MPTEPLKVGDTAPTFALMNEDGEEFRLNELKGKQAVLLFFYPGDFTPGCTLQLTAVRDDWKKFQEMNLAVYGINHADAKSHLAFREKHNFPFHLLIDENRSVSRAYGAVRKIIKATVTKRSVIGIDRQGVIRFIKRGLPKNQDILKAMKPYTI